MPVISDVEHLTTATMNRIKKQYKWCIYWKLVMVYGDITGRLVTRSGNKIKAKNPVQFADTETNSVIYFSYIMSTSEKYVKEWNDDGDKSQEYVQFTWIKYPQLLFLLYFCYQCGTVSCWRGRVPGVIPWRKAPASFTVTCFWFLLINHLIQWCIFMTIRRLTQKQGWTYGWGWICFQ